MLSNAGHRPRSKNNKKHINMNYQNAREILDACLSLCFCCNWSIFHSHQGLMSLNMEIYTVGQNKLHQFYLGYVQLTAEHYRWSNGSVARSMLQSQSRTIPTFVVTRCSEPVDFVIILKLPLLCFMNRQTYVKTPITSNGKFCCSVVANRTVQSLQQARADWYICAPFLLNINIPCQRPKDHQYHR